MRMAGKVDGDMMETENCKLEIEIGNRYVVRDR